jgi:pimeloyl-ACP methyl ester carboxylesterase
MSSVRSADGTKIAYDVIGTGPPVILVGGAFSYRAWPQPHRLAEELADTFTVINYDRRGRGESGDTPPFVVEREFEDLDALIVAAGGSACVWGWSSGAVLALKAAARGARIERLALFDPVFAVDDEKLPPPNFVQEVTDLIAHGRRGAATKYYFTRVMGIPSVVATGMRLVPGLRGRLDGVAHTLPYEAALVEDALRGKPLRAEDWRTVRMPSLVLSGEKSEPLLRKAATAIADALPNAELRILARQGHNPSMTVMASALKEFFGAPGEREAAA